MADLPQFGVAGTPAGVLLQPKPAAPAGLPRKPTIAPAANAAPAPTAEDPGNVITGTLAAVPGVLARAATNTWNSTPRVWGKRAGAEAYDGAVGAATDLMTSLDPRISGVYAAPSPAPATAAAPTAALPDPAPATPSAAPAAPAAKTPIPTGQEIDGMMLRSSGGGAARAQGAAPIPDTGRPFSFIDQLAKLQAIDPDKYGQHAPAAAPVDMNADIGSMDLMQFAQWAAKARTANRLNHDTTLQGMKDTQSAADRAIQMRGQDLHADQSAADRAITARGQDLHHGDAVSLHMSNKDLQAAQAEHLRSQTEHQILADENARQISDLQKWVDDPATPAADKAKYQALLTTKQNKVKQDMIDIIRAKEAAKSDALMGVIPQG